MIAAWIVTVAFGIGVGLIITAGVDRNRGTVTEQHVTLRRPTKGSS